MRTQPPNEPNPASGRGGCEISNEWSGRWDSNPRRLAWEASTLPLSYARSQRQTQYSLYYIRPRNGKTAGSSGCFIRSLSLRERTRVEASPSLSQGRWMTAWIALQGNWAIVTHLLGKGARLCATTPGNYLNGNAMQATFALPLQVRHPVGMHPGPVLRPLLAGGPLRFARHIRRRYHRQRPLHVQQHV